MPIKNQTEPELRTARQALLQGRIGAARVHVRNVLSVDSQNSAALHMLALVQAKDGYYSKAAESLELALTVEPTQLMWCVDLATIYAAAGTWSRAASQFARALARSPNDRRALAGYARSLLELGESGKAVGYFEQLVKIQPDAVNATCGLARAYIQQDRFDEAAGVVKRFLERYPCQIECLRVLGTVYSICGEHDLSRPYWQTVLNLASDDTEALSHLTLACWEAGDLKGALAYGRTLLATGSAPLEIHSFYLYLLLFSDCETASSVREACEQFGQRIRSHKARRRLRRTWDPEKRLRIGYLTGEFTVGPAFYFLSSFLANHDPTQVDVFCYHTRSAFDDRTSWYERVGHWTDCRRLQDKEIKERLHRDKIDILVDLSGVFPDHRLRIFAERAAPVQVTYPNCPLTTGVPEMDYIFTDEWTCPYGHESQYTEEPIRLPGGYLAYTPPDDAPPLTPLPARRDGVVTFGLFQRRVKMNSGVWDVISEILRSCPRSRLLIQNIDTTLDDIGSRARQELLYEFLLRGISEDRIRLVGARSQRQTMTLMAEADIALDTFPYQGQTTTCECLWMGVPVVALSGDIHVARVGSAILERVGFQHLVATTRKQYVANALGLAAELESLSLMRMDMRDHLRRTSLLDGKRLASEIEAAYRWMWRRCCAQSQNP